MARRLVSTLFMTLDGVVESPEQWSLSYWNDEIQNAMSGGMFDSDALLLGRVTYQSFAQSWGSRTMDDDPGTAHMNGVRKYVASHSLTDVDWNNSVLLEGDTADAIRALKDEDGTDIAVSGSPTLVRWLLGEKLLDELMLLVYPVVVGHGATLFTGSENMLEFTLAQSTAFSNGVIQNVYLPAT